MAIAAGCGNVASSGQSDATLIDSPALDGPPPALGTMANPAHTCAELRVAGMPSAAYWVRDPAGSAPAFEVYCEQEINGGGWALVENSVRRDDGTTAAFWQFKYADRLKRFGTLAADQNYYNGALYLIGTEYMDVFVDLQAHMAVAAVMTTTGFDPASMTFASPTLTVGNMQVFNGQFAAGWSSQDFDNDVAPTGNCAILYSNISQHYSNCWSYSLGSDADRAADDSTLDGGVGPHVNNTVLTALSLSVQPDGGNYSQVQRIARFTRW
jgi:hypothetical protein